MQRWLTAGVVLWLGTTGCVSLGRFEAERQRTQAFARVAAEEAARARALQAELQARRQGEDALVRALEQELSRVQARLHTLEGQRQELEAELAVLRDALGESETRRRLLEEEKAQLAAQQQELEALHSELSNVWFRSALSRARRRGLPSPTTATP